MVRSHFWTWKLKFGLWRRWMKKWWFERSESESPLFWWSGRSEHQTAFFDQRSWFWSWRGLFEEKLSLRTQTWILKKSQNLDSEEVSWQFRVDEVIKSDNGLWRGKLDWESKTWFDEEIWWLMDFSMNSSNFDFWKKIMEIFKVDLRTQTLKMLSKVSNFELNIEFDANLMIWWLRMDFDGKSDEIHHFEDFDSKSDKNLTSSKWLEIWNLEVFDDGE